MNCYISGDELDWIRFNLSGFGPEVFLNSHLQIIKQIGSIFGPISLFSNFIPILAVRTRLRYRWLIHQKYHCLPVSVEECNSWAHLRQVIVLQTLDITLACLPESKILVTPPSLILDRNVILASSNAKLYTNRDVNGHD